MEIISIKSLEELSKWLDEHESFQDGFITNLQPEPRIGWACPSTTDSISFEIGYIIHDQTCPDKQIVTYKVTGRGVKEWSFRSSASCFKEHNCIEFDLCKSDIAQFVIIIDDSLKLICNELSIQHIESSR